MAGWKKRVRNPANDPTFGGGPESVYALTREKKWKRRKRILITLVVMKLLGMYGCYPPYRGVVLDGETKKPIQGAVVLVTYSRVYASVGGEVEYPPSAVKETVTDAEGRFFLGPELVWEFPGLICWFGVPRFYAVTPGHGSYMNYGGVSGDFAFWRTNEVPLYRLPEATVEDLRHAKNSFMIPYSAKDLEQDTSKYIKMMRSETNRYGSMYDHRRYNEGRP